MPYLRIARRYEVVFSELRHGKLTRRVWVELACTVRTRQLLLINLPLQCHEGMNESLGTIVVAIISLAQQARPNWSGHTEFFRLLAQLASQSSIHHVQRG